MTSENTDYDLPEGADETYRLVIEERQVPDDAPGLRELLNLGLISPNPVRPGRYTALDGQIAIRHLMATEQAALHRTARRMASITALERLTSQHDQARFWGGPGSEFLPTPDLVNARIAESVSRAKNEVLTAQPGYRRRRIIEDVMDRDVGLLLRGVTMRVLYHASTRENPNVKDYTRAIQEHGGEIRVLHGPFSQIIIIDSREAFIRNVASEDEGDLSGWHVRDLAAVTYMREAYLTDWMRAEPWGGDSTPQPTGWLTERQRQILALMAEGFELNQIGKRLGVSPRTVATAVSTMRERAGVTTTLQLAVWWGQQLAAAKGGKR
ncbi:LuxR C-terminal-related transcriptional regulator [Streptomyces sp. NPDC057854]|uniref:helix-turn-helix transcriptional regulator n=1 Tax=unclassified Streptomyces TaxID=2593676 RepID=UPI0036B4EB8D